MASAVSLLAPTLLACTAPRPKLLRDFRVVCVSPSTPGNVGMIARAIANFEAGGLTIVAPGYDRSDPECVAFERRLATQSSALQVLDEARVCSTLAEAISGCEAAVGFTRRRGVLRSASSVDITVGQLASLLPQCRSSSIGSINHHSEQSASPSEGQQCHKAIALVFGREADGLHTSELLQCSFTCEILTSATHGSLNLAQAATFALGRAFEETYYATSRAATTQPMAIEKLSPDIFSTDTDHGLVLHPLGADQTSRRASLLRPFSSVTSASSTQRRVPGAAGNRPQVLPALQPASASELDVLIRRFLSLAYPRPESATDGIAKISAALVPGAQTGPVEPKESESKQDISDGNDVALAATSIEAWVRTSRGSRPATPEKKTEAIVRRVLQRAHLTGKELRALHGAVRQVERRLNGGEYYNG